MNQLVEELSKHQTHAEGAPCAMWLIPQFVFLTLGVTGATLYLIRLARGPHVTLRDKKNNPEPWNQLDPTYQYKFVAVNTDYKNLKKEDPDF